MTSDRNIAESESSAAAPAVSQRLFEDAMFSTPSMVPSRGTGNENAESLPGSHFQRSSGSLSAAFEGNHSFVIQGLDNSNKLPEPGLQQPRSMVADHYGDSQSANPATPAKYEIKEPQFADSAKEKSFERPAREYVSDNKNLDQELKAIKDGLESLAKERDYHRTFDSVAPTDPWCKKTYNEVSKLLQNVVAAADRNPEQVEMIVNSLRKVRQDNGKDVASGFDLLAAMWLKNKIPADNTDISEKDINDLSEKRQPKSGSEKFDQMMAGFFMEKPNPPTNDTSKKTNFAAFSLGQATGLASDLNVTTDKHLEYVIKGTDLVAWKYDSRQKQVK